MGRPKKEKTLETTIETTTPTTPKVDKPKKEYNLVIKDGSYTGDPIIDNFVKTLDKEFRETFAEEMKDNESGNIEQYAIVLYKELKDDLIQTPYTNGTIIKLQEECELSLKELKVVTNIIATYGVQPHSMKELIHAGIPIRDLAPVVKLYREENYEAVNFTTHSVEPLSDTLPKTTYIVADIREYVSIGNIIFLHKLTHGGTAEQIQSAISDIRYILESENWQDGLASALYKMHDLPKLDSRFSQASLEQLTRGAINRLHLHNISYDDERNY